MTRTFETTLLGRVPPWLRRTVGAPIVRAFGAVLDAVAATSREAVKARFPDPAREDALALIGSERRIERGPGEPALTYAGRAQIWLDSHRTRGGAYALLGQLFAFWRYTLNVPIEVVAASGGRESMDTSGAITRDVVSWTGGGDLAAFWAQDWIFFHTASTIAVDELITDGGIVIVDDAGVPLVAGIDLTGGTIPTSLREALELVPRTWRPAHLKRCTIVLMYGTGRVLGYPPGDTIGDGYVLGADAPIQIVIDF